MKDETVLFPVGDDPPAARFLYGLDVREALKKIPDASIHLVCTSPPYWGLRDYGTPPSVWGGDPECVHEFDLKESDHTRLNPGGEGMNRNRGFDTLREQRHGFCRKCGAWFGNFGLEPDPDLYVKHLVEIGREIRRVLRPDGTFWMNLGDSFASGNRRRWDADGKFDPEGISEGGRGRCGGHRPPQPAGIKPKDLVGVPWMAAFAFRNDGWWLRRDVVWCLSGGTPVYVRTERGDRPMTVKDAARLVPDTVKLWNGKKWTKVLGWARTRRNADELELILRSGERISCTPFHQWPTCRGLLPANELKIGDHLKSVELPEPENSHDPEGIPKDAAWFLGIYLAEGSKAGGKQTLQISGHVKEKERFDRIRKVAEFYGGSASLHKYGNCQHIQVFGKLLCALVEEHIGGKIAKDKHLKAVCWNRSNGWLRSFLDGYLEGDGHWEARNNRWRLGFTKNYSLERDLRVLAARLNIHLVLNPVFYKCQNKSFPGFKGEIRFFRSKHWSERDPNEIVKIKKARCRETYNIGVEDDPHVFALASGILTHNSKPNPMPESVMDRPSTNHEYIFMFAKSERYFYGHDAVKEPVASGNSDIKKMLEKKDRIGGKHKTLEDPFSKASAATNIGRKRGVGNPDGRAMRSVWNVATVPFPGSHFATWPPKLAERMIFAGTPTKDENGRRPTVLDPFCGSGTTGMAALKNGRNFIGIDLNEGYLELAKRRVLGLDAPEDETEDGQGSVLDMFGEE